MAEKPTIDHGRTTSVEQLVARIADDAENWRTRDLPEGLSPEDRRAIFQAFKDSNNARAVALNAESLRSCFDRSDIEWLFANGKQNAAEQSLRSLPAGDDPACKSSTVPSQSDFALVDAGIGRIEDGKRRLQLGEFRVLAQHAQAHRVEGGDDQALGAELSGKAKEFLKTTLVDSTILILKGKEDKELLKFSREGAVDLLVMGAYGHNRLREMLVGSTTSTVIRKSTIPVLLTR